MKYETPDIVVLQLKILDVICTSGLADGSGDDYHEVGGNGSGSTNAGGQW